MALPTFLASTVLSWAEFYDSHQLVSVTVRFLHMVGLLVGGGTALATDRHLVRAARSGPSERAASFAALGDSHRVVVPALGAVVLTGLLMTAADTPTFLGSRLYWSKMGLVTLLFLNGLGILAAERAVARGRERAWRWLGVFSGASLGLWLAILFAGIWLTVAA
jgi:hypothetical protein